MQRNVSAPVSVSRVFVPRVFQAAALCAVAMLGACSPALNWRQVQPEGVPGLQALFPCKPKVEQRELAVQGASDRVRAVHLLRCEAGGRIWALSFTTVDDAGQVPQVLTEMATGLRTRLEAAGQGGVAGPVQTLELGSVAVPGATPQAAARAVEMSDGQGRKVRAWHFSHGLSVFQASVWQHGGAISEQDADDASNTFLAGFQFQS